MFGLDITSMVLEPEQTASLLLRVRLSTIAGIPVTHAVQKLGGAARNLDHLAEGILMSKRLLQNDTEAVGTFTYLLGGFLIGRAAQSLLDDFEEDIDPQGSATS